MAPTSPEGNLQSLPPRLRKKSPNSIPESSQASQGLSVQVLVIRIFTDMSISPSLSLRQRPDRYAFRAGRNLLDNEFRYLRTVIVTAAVHRGFGRQLLERLDNQLPSPSGTGQASAPIYCLTTLRRPVFLVNSRLGLVTATICEDGAPSSEVTGPVCRVT